MAQNELRNPAEDETNDLLYLKVKMWQSSCFVITKITA